MLEYNLDSHEKLVTSVNKTQVQEGKYYSSSCSAIGINGKEYCAYFSMILLDKDGNEILRRIRWLNDFTGIEKTYEVKCRAEPRTKYILVVYRANTDGTNTSKLNLKLSNLKNSQIIEISDDVQSFDELYDYRLIWSRNKNVKKDDWDGIGQTKEQFEKGGLEILSLLKKAGLKQNSKILDVGCGFGRTTNALINFLNEEGCYYGIDVGEESINFCKDNYKKSNFFFIKNNSTNIPITEQKFDIILFSSVFTHLYPNQIKEFLKHCKSLIDEGGVIVGDILEKNNLKDYTGMISRVTYQRNFFNKLVESEGLRLKVVSERDGSKWNVDKRPFFKISKMIN